MATNRFQTLLAQLSASDVTTAPFPHLVVVPATSPDYYRELADSFPDSTVILRGRQDKLGNAAARLPHKYVVDNPLIPRVWHEFFDTHTSPQFWRDIVNVFGADFKRLFPAIEDRMGKPIHDWSAGPRGIAKEIDVALDCQFVINTPSSHFSSVKTAHVDQPSTIFSALFYLRDQDDQSAGANLDLYQWKRSPRFFGPRLALPSDIRHSTTISYQKNALVAFVNHQYAIHGVSPRGPASLPRRYINLVARVPFDACGLRRLTVWERIRHYREIKTQEMRSIGGDRY